MMEPSVSTEKATFATLVDTLDDLGMRRYPSLEALASDDPLEMGEDSASALAAFASDDLIEMGEGSASALALAALDMRRLDSVVWMTKFLLLRWMGGARPNSNASRKVKEDDEEEDAASAVVETWRRRAVVADRENFMVDQ